MLAAPRPYPNAMRLALIAALVFVVPPVLWTSLIWADKLPSGWEGPTAFFALLALVMLPGFAAIWKLRLRPSTKVLILPFYGVGMGFSLVVWGLLFACGAMHDCL
jgi:hypothetical protein